MTSEQHLGDRLAALIDGELSHDDRERVLAHLATCPCCKAEADAQRRLKSVFADSALPPPSAGLMARLQGLPAGPPSSSSDGGRPDRTGGWPAGLLPGGSRRDSLLPDPSRLPGPSGLMPQRGFPIFPGGRPENGTSARVQRGQRHRVAFAAAGAFSLAAFAIGGALATGVAGLAGGSPGSGTAPTVAAGSGVPSASAARTGHARDESASDRRAVLGGSGGESHPASVMPGSGYAGVAVSPTVAALLASELSVSPGPAIGPVAVSRAGGAAASASSSADETSGEPTPDAGLLPSLGVVEAVGSMSPR